MTSLIRRALAAAFPPPPYHGPPVAPVAEESSGPLVMKLRLSSVRQDSVGWSATFYGKPDVLGNDLAVPVAEDVARRLVVGEQYLFVEEPAFLRSEREIRAEIERLEAYPQGSYEELAGATAALAWVLGEAESFSALLGGGR